MVPFRLKLVCRVAFVLFAMHVPRYARADHTAARLWNEQLLRAISLDTGRPTVHARNLFHLSRAMYDAWAAYDSTAQQYVHREKVFTTDVEAARNEAISYAAYNMILHRFVTGPAGVGPGRAATVVDIRQQMTDLGFNPDFTSTAGNSPAALGNRIAQSVINQGLADGANEMNRTAAEVLTLLTGSEYFPGGIITYDIPIGSGLDFEYGPIADMQLQFATYFDASDQASLSRLSGGIHPPADDFAGRRIGRIAGPAAWNLAMAYFNGTAVPEPASVWLLLAAVATCDRWFRSPVRWHPTGCTSEF